MRACNIGDLATNADVSTEVPWYRQIFSDFTKALPGLATTYLTIKQQGELNKINLDRANRGQPAISAQDYQTGVNVGVSRSTENTILIGVAVLAGAYLLSNVSRGRRR